MTFDERITDLGTAEAFRSMLSVMFLRPEERVGMLRRDKWEGCYEKSLKGVICDDTFSHPAKMSWSLVTRIVRHLFEERWIERGSLVLDPFGGVGVTGIACSFAGVRSVLVELEDHFVTLAEASFRLHNKTWQHLGLPRPVIVQGDSRQLLEIIGGEQAQVILTSPPYVDGCARTGGADPHPEYIRGGKVGCVLESYSLNYSSPAVVLTSPPFGEQQTGGGLAKPDAVYAPDGSRFGINHGYQGQGATLGQLAAMHPGSHEEVVHAIITSPPYSEGLSKEHTYADDSKRNKDSCRRIYTEKRIADTFYGRSEGQLGNLNAETYWESVAQVYCQCFALLPENSHMVVVIKQYVRAGKLVDLPCQTAELLEAVGFHVVHIHEAMLVSKDSQLTLDGREHRKSHKSFFRRLCEAKGAPRIDAEIVLCAARGEQKCRVT